MKKILFIILLLISFTLFADNPNPPPEGPHQEGGADKPGHGHGHGHGGGEGAPIDGGLGILLILGAVYGSKKLYKIRKHNLKEQQE